MNCECNNKSNRVKPGIKHVYGNVLRMAIPLTLRTLVKDGDEMDVTDTDFIPSSDHPVRVVFSKGKTNYPIIATMDGNVAIVEDKGKIPVGTYDISVECYDDLGNPYRFKQNAVLYVADTTAEAGIDEEIEYEAQTWYLNAAVFLATTEIGEIGDVIDAKLDDVFGNVAYDADAKEIRFYNKGNSKVLATIDSSPFIADGTVADVYIDVSRQVLVVVLNEDAGGRMFSVPLYLVFNSYYKKDEVDSLVSSTVKGLRFDFSQELPLVVPVTKNGNSITSTVDFGAIDNAIREDGRLVVACVNNSEFYQLLDANLAEVSFSQVNALDGYQVLLTVDTHNVWRMEDVDLGTGGGGGYEPPAGGIPKTDLATGVQTSLGKADSAIQGVKVNGTELTPDANKKVDVTVPTKLSDLAADATHRVVTDAEKSTWSGKQSAINDLDTIRSGAGKGTTSVQTISVNGGTAQQPTNGVVNLTVAIAADMVRVDNDNFDGETLDEVLDDVYTKSEVDTKVAEAGSGAVSVTTNQDGTFVIHVGSTDYTINLNHTHENMAKLVVCEESDLPSTLAKDTIYCQVDDTDTPTEIQSLWIAGLEFVGGGGAIDDTPRLITPRDGLTLDFDGQSTIQLTVRGKNLLSDLSLTVAGDFTVTDGNNAAVSTITATAANNGVVLRLTKGSNYNSGTLRIFSSEVDVTVTLNRDISLPAGYSLLEAVSVNSTILSLANTNIPIYSSWRLVLRSNDSSTSQVAICQNISSVGRYFGTNSAGKWGLAPSNTLDGFSVTAKTEALVEFGESLSKLTIGGNSITESPKQRAGNYLELFGCSVGDHFYFKGYVYEIECVSGGLFHAFPAKRLSDNAVGLYDIENDVFYTGFSS